MKYLSRPICLAGCAAGAVALSCLLPLQAIAQNYSADYSAINIFGDSLVDSGNLFNLTGLPPSPPYAQKFSNGTVWVEPLADELGLSPALSSDVLPGLLAGVAPPPTEGINFALAGSLSSNVNVGSPQLPGLQQQIETFGVLSPVLSSKADALYILLAGGNDYNEAIFNPDRLTTTLDNLPNQVTDNLTGAASALIGLGAEHLLIANLPDLGKQPFAQQLKQINPDSDSLLSAFAAEHNQLLDQKLTALATTADARITQLDLNALFNDIATNPGSFGFTNTQESCLTNFQPGFVFDGICDNPDEFVFWDNVHPTAAVHDAIAQYALTTLNEKENNQPGGQEVPEPSIVLGLLLAGSGVLFLRRPARMIISKTSSTLA